MQCINRSAMDNKKALKASAKKLQQQMLNTGDPRHQW